MQVVIKRIRVHYEKVINSIAFYPIIIALFFLGLSTLMVTLDFSETGRNIKSDLTWLRLKDATTARSIISAIAAGIISLTVFSFSMVMIVLNQAASQMSNRVLDNLIGNRFQQIILGIYIGTIVYSLFLLSTIRDNDSGLYVPALSTYLLITLTILDIFLFIYFLHYITDSVKYKTIIHRISEQTLHSMKYTCRLGNEPEEIKQIVYPANIFALTSGIYQGFDKEAMLKVCVEKDLVISFVYAMGTFLVEGTSYATVSKKIDDKINDQLQLLVDINEADSIERNYYYGIRQLVEVAVKALSPGINDPGTAIESLRAITRLLVYRLNHFPDKVIQDTQGKIRIMSVEKTFEEIFTSSILPIWQYGKEDRMLRQELFSILKQLQLHGDYSVIKKLLQFIAAINEMKH